MADYNNDFWVAFYNRTVERGYLSNYRAAEMADYALALARFETADWSSNVFVTDNNAIGYKYYPASDWQSGRGSKSPEGDYYARYARMQDSACELADWIYRRRGYFGAVGSLEGFAGAVTENGYHGVSLEHYLKGLNIYYEETDKDGFSESPPDVVQSVRGFLAGGVGRVLMWVAIVVIGICFLGWVKSLRRFKI